MENTNTIVGYDIIKDLVDLKEDMKICNGNFEIMHDFDKEVAIALTKISHRIDKNRGKIFAIECVLGLIGYGIYKNNKKIKTLQSKIEELEEAVSATKCDKNDTSCDKNGEEIDFFED